MAYVWQRWLVEEFRAAGLEVDTVAGWENRGRPASTGSFDPRGPVTTHHTGAASSAARPAPTLAVLIQGRDDLPGPLCQWTVDYTGKVTVIAAGRANHAGRIGKLGVAGMPLGADGNALALGDEVDTDGTQTMPAAQRHAIAVTNAIALRHYGRGPEYAHRHQDISGTGKWDLGSLTTTELRTDAAAELDNQEDDMSQYAEQLDRIEAAQKAQAAELATIKRRMNKIGENAWERDKQVKKLLKDQGVDLEAILAAVDQS